MQTKHKQGILVVSTAAAMLTFAGFLIDGIVHQALAPDTPPATQPMCNPNLKQDTSIYQAVVEHRTDTETWYEGYAAAAANLQTDLLTLLQETGLSEAALTSVTASKQAAAAADTNPNPETKAAFTAALNTAEQDITAFMSGCDAHK